MKHLHFTILLAVLMSMAGAKAWAYDIAVENEDGVTFYYNYISDGKELEVAGLSGAKENVNIPKTVIYKNRQRDVTSIGSRAFSRVKGMISVTIPNSVTSIGSYAFYRCPDLNYVTIGNSVTSIGTSAFSWCNSLTSVTIPNSVTTIGTEAFEDCQRLTSVTIGNSVASIGEDAFRRCTIKEVFISDLAAWCKICFGNISGAINFN